MTQQIIDIGANANDGTGEPLRQAFQAVNDNFSNIWAAGPVDSQVVISNNVVSTNVTNLDLVLAGNGIGNVTVESTLIPGIDSVYDLGSPSNYFDTAYARYYYGNGAYLTGVNRGGSGGNVYFRATPPLNPNIGDIWIDSDTAVQYLYFNDNTANIWAEMEAYQSFGSATGGSGNGVPGGSNTQIQFNDQGLFGGSSALTFDTTTNTLGTVNLLVSAATVYDTLATTDINSTGNITANVIETNSLVASGNVTSSYFIGNGSQLTGITATANAAGSNTTIQYNNNGSLAGSANLVYNTSVNQLQLAGNLRIGGSILTPGTDSANISIYGGGSNYFTWTFDNLGRLVLPTINAFAENATILANSSGLKLQNNSGNVVVNSVGNAWVFTTEAILRLPPAPVTSTPVNPTIANHTQKTIRGAIDTVFGLPVASYSDSLSQTETIWTATNSYVTSARMTLRIQYGNVPVTGIEMCDVVLAKEYGTNANVSYVISNRIRTNNSLGYANIVAGLDGSNNLIVTVTNSSDIEEYYNYSITEFVVTNL